jgi:hypothetical protein
LRSLAGPSCRRRDLSRPGRRPGRTWPRVQSHRLPGASRGAPPRFLEALPAGLGAEEVGMAPEESSGCLRRVLHFHSTHGIPDHLPFLPWLLHWRFLPDCMNLAGAGAGCSRHSAASAGSPAKSGPRTDSAPAALPKRHSDMACGSQRRALRSRYTARAVTAPRHTRLSGREIETFVRASLGPGHLPGCSLTGRTATAGSQRAIRSAIVASWNRGLERPLHHTGDRHSPTWGLQA